MRKGKEEVEFEESFDSDSSKKADIALKSDGKYVAVIEVKRSSRGLDQVDLKQVVTYAHQLGVQIIALTNGKRWWMYSTSVPGLQFKDRKFLDIDVISGDPAKSAAELTKYLLKRRLSNGAAVNSAEKALSEQHAKQTLITDIKKVWKPAYNGMIEDAGLFSDVVAYVLTALIKDKKVSRNQVVQAIREIHEIPETASQPRPRPATKTKAKSKKGATGNKSAKPGYVIVMGKRFEVSTYKDILFATLHALYNKFGDRLLDVISSNWEDSHTLLATSSQGRFFRQLDDFPYWVHAHGSSTAMVWKARKLLKEAGEPEASLRMYDDQGNQIEVTGLLVLPKK